MKRETRLPSTFGLALALLILTATVLIARKPATILRLPATANGIGNPQDFFISAPTSSAAFSYNFRYDPRAADEWLFHSGAWLFTNAARPSGINP